MLQVRGHAGGVGGLAELVGDEVLFGEVRGHRAPPTAGWSERRSLPTARKTACLTELVGMRKASAISARGTSSMWRRGEGCALHRRQRGHGGFAQTGGFAVEQQTFRACASVGELQQRIDPVRACAGLGQMGAFALASFYEINGCIHGDPVNPGGEACVAAEGREPDVGAQKRFLRGFFGVGGVSGDAKGDPEGELVVLRDQLAEGVAVAGQYSSDDLMLGVRHSRD